MGKDKIIDCFKGKESMPIEEIMKFAEVNHASICRIIRALMHEKLIERRLATKDEITGFKKKQRGRIFVYGRTPLFIKIYIDKEDEDGTD